MYIVFYITLVIIFLYGVLINYYERSWKKIPDFDCGRNENRKIPVSISVIIPARNEEKNIFACLDALKKQTYPHSEFEVIVVDDHSSDNTASIVREFAMNQLRLIHLSDYLPTGVMNAFKKKAIEAGIANAKGSLIVTTDADCVASPDWLQCMASYYLKYDAAFIAAPVRMNPGKGLLSVFQALDFLSLQGITAASVYNRFHNMSNGANLAYAKAVFEEVGGFAGIDHISSGDDMLLMHKIAERYPGKIHFLKAKAAIVTTSPEPTWPAFLNQRVRWASKSGVYTDKKLKSVLLLVYLVNLCLLSFLVAGFFRPVWWLFFILLLVVKFLMEISFMRKVATFYGLNSTLVYFPCFQPLHVVYIVVAGWLGIFGTYKWKERKVK